MPPGFSVLAEDLDRLVEQKAIARYELAGRLNRFYVQRVVSHPNGQLSLLGRHVEHVGNLTGPDHRRVVHIERQRRRSAVSPDLG